MRWPIFVSPFYGIIFNCFVIDDFWGWLSACVCVCVCSLYGNQMRNAVLVSGIPFRRPNKFRLFDIWKCVRTSFFVRCSSAHFPYSHAQRTLVPILMTMSCEASRPAERMEFYGLSIFDGCTIGPKWTDAGHNMLWGNYCHICRLGNWELLWCQQNGVVFIHFGRSNCNIHTHTRAGRALTGRLTYKNNKKNRFIGAAHIANP